jgi:hypothetical protein
MARVVMSRCSAKNCDVGNDGLQAEVGTNTQGRWVTYLSNFIECHAPVHISLVGEDKQASTE